MYVLVWIFYIGYYGIIIKLKQIELFKENIFPNKLEYSTATVTYCTTHNIKL